MLMFTIISTTIISCVPKNNPKRLEDNIEAYQLLVALIIAQCNPTKIIEEESLDEEIKILLDSLNIYSVAYNSLDTNAVHKEGNFIRFCGKGNLFTGDSCYTYNYGDMDLDIRNNQNSGCERLKLFGKWYKDYIYFD